MKSRYISIISIFCLSVLVLSACGKKDDQEQEAQAQPTAVSGQLASASRQALVSLSYPGTVAAEREAKVMAKSSGNLTGFQAKVGDRVRLGQELAKIDEVGSSSSSGGSFNASQIKQARIAVEQAEGAYRLAKSNYDNLLISSVKDLRQAEIARDQAAKGQTNLDLTAAESLKSAELAYETAKIAVEQAKLTLENREKLADQGLADAKTNAGLAADAVASTAGAIISGINSLTAFDDNNTVTISYSNELGALDSVAKDRAKNSYDKAKSEYDKYRQAGFATPAEKVAAGLTLANYVKQLADDTKTLLDKTITSSNLPLTSLSGPSLNSLQAAASGYQTQASAALSQVSAASQTLAGVELNNSTLLDSLRQAYEIAQQQAASASQSLNNLKAGNASQKDQAGFAYSLAQNQYDNLKVKIEAQVAAARTGMENAELQYNNASLALESLYDSHSVIAPLDGVITQILAADGQAVSPGQAVLTVSQTEKIKVQFYVEPENLSAIKPGLPVAIEDNNGNSYAGAVAAVSPQADPITRRFLAEITLENPAGLLLGTIVSVKLEIAKSAGGAGYYILPLSAVNVTQDGQHIFIIADGLARLIPVEVASVSGELARIKADLAAEAIIVTDGNKVIKDGDPVALR